MMATQNRDGEKLERFKNAAFLVQLEPPLRRFVLDRARNYRLTFQELRLVSEAARDLSLWGGPSLESWWKKQEADLGPPGVGTKKALLARLDTWVLSLRRADKSYPKDGLPRPARRSLHVVAEPSRKKIVGPCPVASDETVCCNLRTIDAVENCGFDCSYCTIQNFYGDRVVVDSRLADKLEHLSLEPRRFYHFGTGQSSDSLMWGNRQGLLDALCCFARRHPNVLLELKTKSDNVAYFLDHTIPVNVVLSWSLNTPTIISNEEHFTASLPKRFSAARRAADRGIPVAFHFHPLVLYDAWRKDYADVARRLMGMFGPEEVLFISFGTVTFIKPVVQAIRHRGRPTKMLQMELVPGPKGKLSYPDAVKREVFRTVYRALGPWHEKVFMYLCMEKAELWRHTFGFAYETNEAFEEDFGRRVFEKLGASLPAGAP